MAETSIAVTPGSGINVGGYLDTAGFFRQVVIIGDTTGNLAAPDSNGNLPVKAIYQSSTPTTATWTAATANSTALTINPLNGNGTALVTINTTGTTVTAGAVIFEGFDGTNWIPVPGLLMQSAMTTPVTTNTLKLGVVAWNIDLVSFTQFRVRMTAQITGTGSPQAVISITPTAAMNDIQMAVGSYGNGQLLTTPGGSSTTTIAAGTNSVTVVKASAGTLCKVLVTTLGTAAMNFFDNASAASGTIVGVVPASAAVGSLYEFHIPSVNGITASASASNPAVTISYT
jgi:hypothetical protein